MPALPLLFRFVAVPVAVWFGGNYVAQEALRTAQTTLEEGTATTEAAKEAAMASVANILGPVAVALLLLELARK